MKKIKVKIIFFIILTILLLAGPKIFSISKFNKKEVLGLQVEKWDNIYEGNNVQFYYLNSKNDNIRSFGDKYKLYEAVNAGDDSFYKSLQLYKWINEKVEYNQTQMDTEKNAIDIILKDNEKIKVSNDDFNTLFSEGAAYLEVINRTGIFRGSEGFKKLDNTYFKVCEIWSNKYSKWIMLDVSNGYYIEENDIPLSALEFLKKGIKNVKFVKIGQEDTIKEKEIKKYKTNIEKYLQTYSIAINNNKYGTANVNAYITYIKSDVIPQIETKEGFIQPTIFVEKEDLFNKSPRIKYVDDENDEKITLIMAKRSLDKDKDIIKLFTAGAFKNSVQIKEYYYSINGHDWVKVGNEYFFDLELKQGKNTIKISEDGSTVIREVIIQNNNIKKKK